jgi:hypothetical protein
MPAVALCQNCYDVFGNICECPTSEDSLLVYENSLKVYRFYENSSEYKKIKIKKISNNKDAIDCFYKLDSSYQAFKEIWQLRERYLKGERVDVLMPRDGLNIPIVNYYERIDEYRFYQREFECGILNTSSPFPIYDIRIVPLFINTYRNHNSNDNFNGDEVEIAMYVPVTVKPFELLTEAELSLRSKLLASTQFKIKKIEKKAVKRTDTTSVRNITVKVNPVANNTRAIANLIIKDSVISLHRHYTLDGTPIYYSNGTTSCLIGSMKKGIFTKLPKEEYQYIKSYARQLLQDDDSLARELRLKFGMYFKSIAK